MSKALTKSKPEDLDGKELVDLSKKNFQIMGRQWWEFAKNIADIKSKEAYEEVGYDDFKAFCEGEYPNIAYSTLMKYAHVVDEFREIVENKIKKDEQYLVPAIDACYLLVTAKKHTEGKEEEFTKIKKDLIDARLSYEALNDKIKNITVKKLPMKTDPKELEEELSKDIEEELEETDVDTDQELDDDFDADDIDSLSKEQDGIEALLKSAIQKCDSLSEYIAQIMAEIKKEDIDNPDVQILADKLSDLDPISDKFFTKLEKLEG